MQELINTNFETGLPTGWSDHDGDATFANGILHSERKSLPSFNLPGHGWRKLKVEVHVDPRQRGIIEFGSRQAMVMVDFRNFRHRLMIQNATTIATNKQAIDRKDVHLITFEFDNGRWRANVDGLEVITFHLTNQPALFGNIGFGFWSGCTVHRVRILGDEPLDGPLYSYPPRKNEDFFLEVAVDMPDDLSYAPYTLKMLDELFAEYASWGVKRCQWIYDGKDEYNWWQFFPGHRYGNYRKTIENFGDDILPTAVRVAHEHGIELHGILKPFEMAYMLHTYGQGTEDARKFGRMNRIGGVIYRSPDFTNEHRELMYSRKPGAYGDAVNDVFTKVELVSDDDRPFGFDINDVQLYVSDDNNTYQLYEGKLQTNEVVEDRPIYEFKSSGPRPTDQSRRVRVLQFTNVEIRNPFFALVAPTATFSLGNTLADLIHVYGPKGEEKRITLGIVPRAGQLEYDIVKATTSSSQGMDFARFGVEFDNIEGSPSSCLAGHEGINEPYVFDAGHQFIAVARGKEQHTVGMASPSIPETRDWWLTWVQDILDSGADGVEMRVRNHHTHMTWQDFGFEKPFRDAFLDRHGVDIWETDDFDIVKWRRMRGEAYTDLCRDVKKLVASHGKPLGMHISRTMAIEPELGASMGIHFDWRTWLTEGLANSVTMKEVFPNTQFCEEILSIARPQGIPLIFSPFANKLFGKPSGTQVCADRIRAAREAGYDGFQLYESCCVMRAHPDGSLDMEQPELREVFQSEFK